MVFVDLETTGATAAADRITEIGLIEVDGNGAAVREWSTLVNPETRISDFIEQLTGISNAMVADAPLFADVAAEVLSRLKGRVFVAHNARFDYGFLKNEFKRAGIDFRATVLCTVKLSRKLFPQHRKHSLDALIERHGLSVSARHRALGDAQLIHQFWNQLPAQVGSDAVVEAVSALTARPSLPAQLDADLIDALPVGHGVYLFYGENDLPLYIGKSRTLKKRVLAHFAADHASSKEMQLAQQVRRVEGISTAGEIGALLLEAALIKRLQPLHNRQLRRNEELCVWRLFEKRPGEWRPALSLARDLEFTGDAHNYGPFKTAKEAKRTLTELAKEHSLCHALLGLEQVKPGAPCFAHQLQQCKGTCIGKEPVSFHSARMMAALGKWRLAPWPFNGRATLREGSEIHVFDDWRHNGTVADQSALDALAEQAQERPPFDRDIYKILCSVIDRLVVLDVLVAA